MPLAYNRDLILTTTIAKTLETDGHVITSKWVLDEDPSWGLSYAQLSKRDFDALGDSDALVAEISSPSHGVGMEIQYAVMNNKVIVCLRRQDSRISGLIAGNKKILVLTYSDNEDVARMLRGKL